ncbi:hypothetical protein ACTFIZ_004777 [Dictyostelium cf. discoideum]
MIQLLISCENEKNKNQIVWRFKRKGYSKIDPLLNENVKLIYGTGVYVNTQDISDLLKFNNDSNVFVFSIGGSKFFMGLLIINEKEYTGNLKHLIGLKGSN